MKRLIALVVTFALWPTIAFGEIDPTEYDSTSSFSDLCSNDTMLLSNQTFVIFREDFVRSRSIKCIDVKNTQLDIIAGSFDGLPNLMYLDLRGNRIVKSSNLFSFGNLLNIRTLKLGGVRFKYNYYEEAVSILVTDQYPQLTYLDLSDIDIRDIEILPSNPFPKLRYLDMSRIHSVKNIVSFLPYVRTLTYLDVSNSGLSEFRLERMSNLLTLTLDGNNFDNIGKGWGSELGLRGLSKLVKLSVANNRISYISETAFRDTVHLRYLNLSMNNLYTFNGEVFSGLNFLEVLVLDGNSLDPISFDRHLNITTLSLNCNNIKNLSMNSFHYTLRLEKLFLNSNKISYLFPQTFKNLVDLSELHLSDNELDCIPTSTWNDLKKLKYLDLSGNALTTLSYLVGCHANRIEFDRNPLEYVNASELSALPKNMLISLNVGMVSQRKSCPLKLGQSDTSDMQLSEYS